ncbi:CAAX prenyl protease 1 [Venturia nashicola]|uniref:CAAX prenyl protease 1 n=1 Tax=Venturia nashicola TaxID=86259 RepID=A0A4Z1P0Y1_9PEZI|nr:CAAX prenyl protease 1 [Venturia nashicola]TLD21040.1 CAAX prenyl protease 1 [Venturia nashicola]
MISSSFPASSLADEAAILVHQLANHNDNTYGLGTMTCAIYDTAWIAMVTKEIGGKLKWLFPESFEYLLERQHEDGSWESYGAEVDGVMNSLAALLALKRHQKQPELSLAALPYDIDTRIERAIKSIAGQLQAWDVESTMHVGFEYLVPALLTMLEADDIQFQFPGRDRLIMINHKKMSRFQPAMLYGEQKMTALHSLEAFIGLIDFDRVRHHKTLGSMMASPSSTAAYLMSASEWDLESEAYLRHVVKFGHGKSSGGVPSAFPSNYFETTWVISTLLEAGFSANSLGRVNLDAIAEKLQQNLDKANGLIGFAPSVGHDADDTSKALLTLELLGKDASPESLIAEYEGSHHFRTYASERDPSLSANCNVLVALLHHPHPQQYLGQIEKCTRFICDEWYRTDGSISDKWNLAQEYPVMLIVQGLTQLLRLYDNSQLPDLPSDLLRDRIPVVLFQALVRCLKSQESDGSWRHSVEATSYAVLALANLTSLPWLDAIAEDVHKTIQSGRQYIETHRQNNGAEHLWIEKVSYGSESLYKAYTLAALHVPAPTDQFGDKVKALASIPWKNVFKFAKFYSMLPIYSSTPEWLLRASLVEGYLFLPRLEQMRHALFPRDNMAEDKYFEYIPFTWTGANNRDGACMNANFLFDMMVVSFLGYQVDEFMETVVGGKEFEHRLPEVHTIIDEIFVKLEACPGINETNGFARLEDCEKVLSTSQSTATNSVNESSSVTTESRSGSLLDEGTPKLAINTETILLQNRTYTPPDSPLTTKTTAGDQLSSITRILSDFTHFIYHHPSVANASPQNRSRVKEELKTYLLAHLTQVHDNARFATQLIPSNKTTAFETPISSYYQWVRTTSADHTSCPHAFAFATCLLSNDPRRGNDCFKTAQEKYVAEDLCRHLASMCRQYNDYGSLQRDRDDKNLNSVNFPEFVGENDRFLKDELLAIAEYEREGLGMAMRRLRALMVRRREGNDVMRGVELFVNVTDVYGQIYVLRDIDGPVGA